MYVFFFFPPPPLPLSSHSCYMPRLSYPQLHHSNYTWRRVQITKLLVMQFSPPFHHLAPLRSKYSPQHPGQFSWENVRRPFPGSLLLGSSALSVTAV
jgi:hypothetical protein